MILEEKKFYNVTIENEEYKAIQECVSVLENIVVQMKEKYCAVLVYDEGYYEEQEHFQLGDIRGIIDNLNAITRATEITEDYY